MKMVAAVFKEFGELAHGQKIKLFQHCRTYSFTYYLWVLSCYIGRVEWLQQRPLAHTAYNTCCLAFYWKSLLALGLGN